MCPSCGEDNPDKFRLCGFCGAPLHAAPTPPVEERKVVTVLFCDLVGFTAASEDADPEDVRARIRPYHSMLRREIEGFGGTVEKFIGDAVMAVFGAPIAHEDDAERAVRAGLRILEAVEDLNEEDDSLGLQVRIGVNTGEVLVAVGARPEEGEGFVTGDVVNTASRLQGVAPVGGIVVGEATFRATEPVFDYVELDPVSVKGKAEPVPMWRAMASRARFGTDITRKLATPLVGRELERNLLTGTFERSVRDNSVNLLTLVGEPGVGKSRLVAELFEFVDSRQELIRWRQGRCLPYGEGVTFWALGEVLKAETGILETDSSEGAASKLDALIPDSDPDAPWLRQRLRPLIGLEAPQATREENFAAWRRFLESLAEDVPTVLVFEDLHWADDALLAFLEHVAEYAQGVPMLMVGTARPELFERAPAWAATARNANRVNLAPLSDAETARLIANLLEQAVLPAELQTVILSRSGGNPLYAEEFVRLLKDRKILTKEGSTWRLDPTAEIPLPSGVQGLISARLDTLASERKRMLQDAAVIGKVFWSGAVAAMQSRDPKEIAQAMHELSRKELVRPARRSSMEGQSEYAFWHGLVRDVCYGQIPRAQRAERHQRAAAWIEEVAGERLEDHAEILASHYGSALEAARAGKAENIEELEAKALHYLMMAGDRSLGMDVEAAERHYARALELVPGDHSARPDVLVRHGEALTLRSRFVEAADAFEEAIATFRAQGEQRREAVAMGRYGMVRYRMGNPDYRTLASQAVALLEPLGPSEDLVRSTSDLAGALFVDGYSQEAIDLAERAMELGARLGLPEQARALGFRGAARCDLGDPGGLDELREALQVGTAQGLGREVAVIHVNIAEAIHSLEGPKATMEAYREAAAFAARRGIEEFAVASAAQSLGAVFNLGSWDEAMALSEELVDQFERTGDVFELRNVRLTLARIHAGRGDLARARPLAVWVEQAVRDADEIQHMAEAFVTSASIRLQDGAPAEAIRLLSELEHTPRIRREQTYWVNLVDAVRTALAAGAPDVAERLVHGLDPVYPLHQHATKTVEALLAERRGDFAQAAEAFADAAGRWKGFEVPWERAQALLGLGRCLIALGRASEAAVPLRQAGQIFASLRAKPAIAEADALLAEGTALSS